MKYRLKNRRGLPSHFSFKKQWTVWKVCVCSAVQYCLTFATHWAEEPTTFLRPWDFSCKNTGVGCHFLLQGIFLTRGLNLGLLCLLHWQAESLSQSHLWSPRWKWGSSKISAAVQHTTGPQGDKDLPGYCKHMCTAPYNIIPEILLRSVRF